MAVVIFSYAGNRLAGNNNVIFFNEFLSDTMLSCQVNFSMLRATLYASLGQKL